MNRVPLGIGTEVCGDRRYIIDCVAGDGANCIVYAAHYFDNANCNHSVLLKECYPFIAAIERHDDTLTWNNNIESERDLSAFIDSYMKLMQFQNDEKHRNSTSEAFCIFNANGTKYSVINKDVGSTFDREKQNSLSDILETILALTKAVRLYHDAGYLHLDIKPSNFLVIPETRQLIKLFDMDTVIKKSDVVNAPCIMYSEGWAAPELVLGQRNKICEATDIYSIGAILFEKVIGRKVENNDTGVFAEWELSSELFDGINPKIKRLLIEIFKKTLAANVDRRYQCADELIAILEKSVKTAKENVYILSVSPVSDKQFVGRQDDLCYIRQCFTEGIKSIFIHGFGGLGKTNLAKEYASKFSDSYDTVVFMTYSSSLKELINEIPIANYEKYRDSQEKIDIIRKCCSTSRVLFIVDNFDVENDERLLAFIALGANIIFTTRVDYSNQFALNNGNVCIFNLKPLPMDEALQIFINTYGNPINHDESKCVEEIYNWAGGSAWFICMTAKYVVNSSTSVIDFKEKLYNSGLTEYGDGVDVVCDNIHGKYTEKTPMELTQIMFGISELSNDLQETLRNLYLLRYYDRSPLTKTEYKKYTKSKNYNAINKLKTLGWIDIVDDNISVHQLVYDLVKSDLTPTCENVPGIYEYIISKFDNLKLCTSIDEAKEITFAMLMYSDISDNGECEKSLYQKLSHFIFTHLEGDIGKVGELLCEAPDESDWHMNADYLATRIFPYNTDDFWSQAEYSIVISSDYYVLNTYLLSKYGDCEETYEPVIVSFEDQKQCLSKIPRCPQCNSILMEKYYCTECETFVPKAEAVYSKIEDDESPNFLSSIIDAFTITRYYEILKKTEFNVNGEKRASRSEEIIGLENNPPLFLRIAHLTQSTIMAFSNADNVDEVFKSFSEAAGIDYTKIKNTFANLPVIFEDMVMQIYASLGQFGFYCDITSMSAAIEIPSLEDYLKELDNHKKLHWTQKAKIWFDSVIASTEKAQDPIAIYRYMLLSDTQINKLKKSQLRLLINSGFVSKLLLNPNIQALKKQDVLIFYVAKQVNQLYDYMYSWKKFGRKMQKYQLCFELYAQCLSLAEPLLEKNKLLGVKRTLSLCRAAFLVKKAGKIFPFDPKQYVLDAITIDNIDFCPELLELANMTLWSGYIKVSQKMKHNLLDICLSDQFHTLPNQKKHLYWISVYQLAKNYHRDDVIVKMDSEFSESLYDRLHICLLECSTVDDSIKNEIAISIVNKYISTVLLHARAEFRNESLNTDITLYDEVIEKYGDIIFENINPYLSMEYCKAFGRSMLVSNCTYQSYHKIYPFLLDSLTESGLYKPSLQEIEGFSYIIFAYCMDEYPDVGGWEGMIDDSLMELSENEPHYTTEQLIDVTENIIRICPEAEEPIKQIYWNGKYPK